MILRMPADTSVNRMQILIVEDDQRLARQLKKGLEEQGHVVNLAFDGVDGLEAALQGCFDQAPPDCRQQESRADAHRQGFGGGHRCWS